MSIVQTETHTNLVPGASSNLPKVTLVSPSKKDVFQTQQPQLAVEEFEDQ